MKNILLVTALFSFILVSCDKEDEMPMVTDYDYHAHINSPNGDAKALNDTLHIHTTFESKTGETVHHVKVRIYNKADNTEVYNKPADAHVHESSGTYEFHDNFVLSNENGVTADSHWVLEAKVWGHEAGDSEVIKVLEFHVDPE